MRLWWHGNDVTGFLGEIDILANSGLKESITLMLDDMPPKLVFKRESGYT